MKTHTVTGGYIDTQGRTWVFVHGLGGKYEMDEPPPERAAVVIAGGRARLATAQ